MQTNEQTDRVQGHSSCKTVFASTPHCTAVYSGWISPGDVSMSLLGPWKWKGIQGLKGVCSSAWVTMVSGVSAQSFPIAQSALLFVSAEFAPNYCLNGRCPTMNNHSTASPNAQDELHTLLNYCAGLVSPTLHLTAGQEQGLPLPNPPLWHPWRQTHTEAEADQLFWNLSVQNN